MSLSLSNTLAVTPGEAARIRRFKFRLSLPGHDIGGDWLCQATGDALAYQSYCCTGDRPLTFTWQTLSDGLNYLQADNGYWLSWETTANCLYLSYKSNAAAWKLEGGRLIRVSDGAVVSRPAKQNWPLATLHFLMALPENEWALTVDLVEEPIPPLVKLLEYLTPVVPLRHRPVADPDRYLYSVPPSGYLDTLAKAQSYAGRNASFFALRQPVQGEDTLPIYLLQLPASSTHPTSFKLSPKKEDGEYRLPTENTTGAPNFHAFAINAKDPFLHLVYEHTAAFGDGKLRYIYDFIEEAHEGWGPGVAVFRAATVDEAHAALSTSTGAQSARGYAVEWFNEHGEHLAKLFDKVGKQDVSKELIGAYQNQVTGLPDIRYVSIGAGLHGGYGLGTVGVESGGFWPLNEFGNVPANTPLADYSVEWVTFGGATGLDIGGSVDACAVGVWYGEVDQINGACNGVTISAQFIGGISVNLLWDGSWQGANQSPHPIGVTVVMALGPEAGAGIFYNASATQFWNRRSDFPDI